MRFNQSSTSTDTGILDGLPDWERVVGGWILFGLSVVLLFCVSCIGYGIILSYESGRDCLPSRNQDRMDEPIDESINTPQPLSYSTVISQLPLDPLSCPIGTTMKSRLPNVKTTITTAIVALDGVTYDKDNYIAWIERQRHAGKPYYFSPLSEQKLDGSLDLEYLTKSLRPNLELQYWQSYDFDPDKLPSCSISQLTFEEPVIDPHGHSFEKLEIERWLSDEPKDCPINRETCLISDLVVNHTLKKAIQMKEQVYLYIKQSVIEGKNTTATQSRTLSSQEQEQEQEQEQRQAQHPPEPSLNLRTISSFFSSFFFTTRPASSGRSSATDFLLEQKIETHLRVGKYGSTS